MSKRCFTLSLGLMAILSVTAGIQAELITVGNASFESPILPSAAPYTTTAAELLPWVACWAAEYRAEDYYNLLGEGKVTPSDGDNVGYLNPSDATWRPYVYQTLDTVYEAGKDYTLTVAASMYNTAGNEGQFLSIQLGYWSGDPDGQAGPTIVAERQIASSELTTETMADFTTSTGPLSGDAVGKQIVVYLGRAAGSATGPQWDIDNVRLAVPEPGTLVLLASALLGLSARGKRLNTSK